MGKFIKDFRDFAMRGNVIDMAVGVIIGGAFGKIVTSLVEKVIMPGIGVLTGGSDFSKLKVKIQDAKDGQEAVFIEYGDLIQTIVNFIIIAFCIFVAIRFMQNLRRKQEEAPAPAAPAGPTQEELLTEIRDLLKKEVDEKK